MKISSCQNSLLFRKKLKLLLAITLLQSFFLSSLLNNIILVMCILALTSKMKINILQQISELSLD